MTVKDLRTLVDNLDEYIHIPGGIDRLKKTILHLAVSGQLVPQIPAEGTGEELYKQIQAEKNKTTTKNKPLPDITEEEKPFEIPDSWRWTRVLDLGSALGQKKPDNDFYYIDVSSINNIAKTLKQPALVAAKDAPSRARKVVKEGTVIYSTVRPYLLNTTIIHNTFDKELIASTAFAILHPFVGVISEWLLFNLISQYFTDYTNNKSVGASYPAINDAQFSMAIMPLPPTSEQKRIVEKVNVIFALIDDLSKKYQAEQAERKKLVKSALAQLARGNGELALIHLGEIIRTKAEAAELRKSILHLAVSGQLVPQIPAEGTGQELYDQIQAEKQKLIAQGKLKKQKPLPVITEDEITFKIPKSWKWVRLGELGEFGSGSTPARGEDKYYGGDINWFKSGELTDTYMIKNSEESIKPLALKECSLRINKPGDIVIAMYGATAGKLGLLEVEGTTNQAVCGFTLFDRVDRLFTFNSLLAYRESLIEKSSGAAQPNISKVKIMSHTFALPPLPEQTRIVQKTTQLLDLVSKLEKHLEK